MVQILFCGFHDDDVDCVRDDSDESFGFHTHNLCNIRMILHKIGCQ